MISIAAGMSRLVGGGSSLFALLALAPAAVRVPAVIAHLLKGFLWNVLGNGGNEFQGGKEKCPSSGAIIICLIRLYSTQIA